MAQAEGTACPKVCRYAGKFVFGELRIVWHDLVIILENGKRRAGKVPRSKIAKGLVIQAKKSGNYVMGIGEEPKDFTVGNTMASLNTWKYHSDCRIEVRQQGNKTEGEENGQEVSAKAQVRNTDRLEKQENSEKPIQSRNITEHLHSQGDIEVTDPRFLLSWSLFSIILKQEKNYTLHNVFAIQKI